jgi:hemoglobin-like flavoprotein
MALGGIRLGGSEGRHGDEQSPDWTSWCSTATAHPSCRVDSRSRGAADPVYNRPARMTTTPAVSAAAAGHLASAAALPLGRLGSTELRVRALRVPAQRATPEAKRPAICRPPARTDVAAIQSSLSAVQRRPVQLAEAFYAHLFELAPPARALFPADLTEQMQKMTTVLIGVITTLSDTYQDGQDGQITALEQSLARLGTLHRTRWQVQPEHYHYIPHALTRAVRDVAGPAWCGTLSSNWIALIQWINSHMLAGADQESTNGDTASPF